MSSERERRGAWPQPQPMRGPSPRRILVLKGFVTGVTKAAYDIAMAKASALIEPPVGDLTLPITTICWDGDKYGSTVASFTHVINDLQAKYPHLEFIFFKEPGKTKNLIRGMGEAKQDKFGNLIGPYYFMTPINTTIRSSNYATPPPYTRSKNWGIDIIGADSSDYADLGVRGLRWIRTVLGIHEIKTIIVGLGETVIKEMAKVARNPEAYPSGFLTTEPIIFDRGPRDVSLPSTGFM